MIPSFSPTHRSRIDPCFGDGSDVAEVIVVRVEGKLVEIQHELRVLTGLVPEGNDVDQLVAPGKLKEVSIC